MRSSSVDSRRVDDPATVADEQRLALACAAARAGGEEVRRRYGATEHTLKSAGDPVTEADLAANRAVLALLGRTDGGTPVLSEESRDDAGRLGHEEIWVVDPLDGTKEFLARNGEFAVMVGLARGGRAVLGAVYLPAPDVLYAGIVGRGAWVERSGGPRESLRCVPADVSHLRMVGSRSHPDRLLLAMQAVLGVTDVEPAGSVGVKCGRIAEGRRDVYIHPVPYLKEWDTCAPEAVLRAAGGTVTDCRGEPLRYNKPKPSQPDGIVACGPGAAEFVLKEIGPLYDAAAPGNGTGTRSAEGAR
jgi:3'(2'), 5'-bisphosphate nucleotidase